ncbi:MAG: hypothetical protein SFZ24_11210 [Planctomycetota bacterium]|nr:hypothetical protein [Planctomycetota bacterium]
MTPVGVDSAAFERRARRFRTAASLAGLALLAAALFVVIRQAGSLGPTLESIRDARPHLLAAALALPALSLALTSLTFWILTTRYGKVRHLEMLALIGAAWLLNYLPLWPGMIGRLAYHKRVNGISLQSGAVAVVWANVLSAAASLLTLAALALSAALVGPDSAGLGLLAALPIPAAAALALQTGLRPPSGDPPFWRLPLTLAIRLIELHIWAARYWVCFSIVGAPLGWSAALAIACATQLATLLPLAGNGLGLREWAVGLLAPALPIALTRQTALSLQTGLTADLVNRAAELILAVPIGLLCAAWIARRLRSAPPPPPASASAPASLDPHTP